MPNLAVIIPTFDEEHTIVECLESVGGRHEVAVVVSDGGSTDGTVGLAETRGATVVEGPPGRGGQLNRGAAATPSELLFFLHADCRVPPGWFEAISEALAEPETALACFWLRTEPTHHVAPTSMRRVWLRTLDLRARGGRLPYGDQGFAVRREVFDQVGRFPEIPLMEDLAFARACRRVGKIRRIPLEIRTGARRTESSPVRARLMMLVFPSLFRVGVPARTLARWYGNPR